MPRKYKPAGRYQMTNYIAVIMLMLITFVSVGYFLFLGKPDEQAAQLAMQAEFDAGRARWQSRSLTTYRYVVDRDCRCPAETDRAYVATIAPAGRSAEFPIPVESSAGTVLSAPTDPVWIEDLFGMVEQTLGDGKPVDVHYNYLHGYPEVVDLNPGGDAADSVDRFEVRDFEVVRP